ncbi:MAG: heavy metal translocating P-type ATPase metal-binding domain-containing protein [Methylococcales bacterium]
MEYCDYCSLEVKVTGFKMDYMDSKKIFCCEGCKAIYTLFGDAHVVKTNEHVASSVSR